MELKSHITCQGMRYEFRSVGAGASWRALGLKTAGAHSTRSLKISGCKRWCPKDLRVCAPASPVLTHSLCNHRKRKCSRSLESYLKSWLDYIKWIWFSASFKHLEPLCVVFCVLLPSVQWKYQCFRKKRRKKGSFCVSVSRENPAQWVENLFWNCIFIM